MGKRLPPSPEARKLLRQLASELEASADSAGERLVWSASEQLVLGQITGILDRKHQLLGLYDEVDDVDVKVKLSGEVRLLEQAAARLIKQISTEMPAPPSRRSEKARQAALARWGSDRAQG